MFFKPYHESNGHIKKAATATSNFKFIPFHCSNSHEVKKTRNCTKIPAKLQNITRFQITPPIHFW